MDPAASWVKLHDVPSQFGGTQVFVVWHVVLATQLPNPSQ
jgi:hypothetical protein